MLKYLEAPDLHFDPQWADVTEQVARRIAEAANEYGVDFIAAPGDITNRALMASEQGGINRLRKIIKIITNTAPVCAVYGTPSHEPPGSLEHLRDVGLVILEPGKIYGYRKGKFVNQQRYNDIFLLAADEPVDAILFGVPELSKKTITAQLGLSAEEANAEAVNYFRQYVEQFIAPRRALYPNVPAVLLMHGNLSDSARDNETDRVLKASDIVIHTEDLRPAVLDRVSMGHIHRPWESRVISAGYAGFTGMDGAPWGNLNFAPAMNLVEIPAPGEAPIITRIHYGTPERRKISKPLREYEPDVAYWLESDDPQASLPASVHPWSRVTLKETKKETRRVTEEQAAAVRSLRDLFLLADPKASESVLKKVDEIESVTASHDHRQIDVQLIDVEVDGCVLFGGRSARINIADLEQGLTAISGGNGSGKSSILSFCSPYPVVIGKDTDSGRPSAIKDFFSTDPARIRKTMIVNGQTHEHVITIKAPHTQNPKTECYLTIDGQPALDKGTFDEMMSKCEDLYGPFSDYLLTTFYVQPQQSKHPSGLMSATMTDIRDLVQSIAGIDREVEKRFALDRVKELTDEAERISTWLEQSADFAVDITELAAKRDQAIADIERLTSDASAIQLEGQQARAKQTEAASVHAESERERLRKTRDQATLREHEAKIVNLTKTIENLEQLSRQVPELEAAIAGDDAVREANREAEAIEAENAALRRKHQEAVDEVLRAIRQRNQEAQAQYQTAAMQARNRRTELDGKRSAAELRVQALDISCPQCGYMRPDAAEELADLREKIHEYEAELALVFDPDPPAIEPETVDIPEPQYRSVPERKPTLANRSTIEATLRDARTAEARIPGLTEQIGYSRAEVARLSAEVYKIVEDSARRLQDAETALTEVTARYQSIAREISQAEFSRDNLTQQIAKANEYQEQIEAKKARLAAASADSEDWSYIARMFMPAKIPALELDLVVDTIDSEATRILQPFEEGRFSYRTETQQVGKAGMVDKFDVLVHDGETGDERSLLKFSPGQKAFLSDAYVKALVAQRNSRRQRFYDPVVMDESDGPVDPSRIAAYYEIQRTYWTDNRVLVVSHNPTAHEHIEQGINIRDIIRTKE